jgi:ABC-type glycerol-3-phosphate transport system permease component
MSHSSQRSSGARAAASVVAGLTLVVVLFPLYWTIATSLKQPADVFRSPPVFLPWPPTLHNYQVALAASAIPRYLLNTVIVGGATVALVLFVSTMAAYGVSRYAFRGKLPFLVSLLVAQVMPVTTLIIPLYIFWSGAGAVDGPVALIATYTAISVPVGTWLLVGFISAVPRQIDEAAAIDGAPLRVIIASVVAPLVRPGLLATGLSVFIYVWQELMISMTFVRTDRLKPLMAGVATFITSRGIEWGPLTAAGILAMLPLLVVYLVFRRALIRGLTAGAVKG